MGELRPAPFVLCLIIVAVGVPPAPAQWATDGAIVTVAANNQEKPLIVTDGRGGALIIWEDAKGVDDDIYMQRLDAMGVRQWGAEGTAVCGAAEMQIWPSLVADGNGGAFTAWYDDRGPSYHTYAQHMDADGLPVWTVDGVWVDTGSSWARMAPDGVGGAFICWQEASTYPNSIAVQRLNTSGAKMWSGAYTIIGTGLNPHPVADGTGGFLVGWARYQSPSYAYWVHGMRLDADGNELWPSTTISPSYGCYYDAPIIADDAGGGIWTYSEGSNVMIQRRDDAGDFPWGANGVNGFHYVVTASDPRIVPDGAGGALVVCVAGGVDLFMNRILADGTLDWGPHALHLCDDAATQTNPQLAPDGHGGAYVVWEDHRNSATTGVDIYAQRVDGEGNPQWGTNGVPICTAAFDQVNVRITATGTRSAIITWEDHRNTATTWVDIYAQAIHFDGSIGDPPFEVIFTTAIQNGIFRPLEDDLVLVCNQELNPATFNSSTFEVWGSLTGPHAGTFSVVVGNAATFDPWDDFDHGEVVTAVATAGIQSTGGAALEPFCWSYTTLSEGVDGEFLAAVSYPVQVRPMAVCAADFDGDDVMDIAAANYDSDTVSILTGNGDGTFGSANNLAVGDSPHGVIAADMDNDNDVDVVVADYGSDLVTVWRNGGSGTFPLYSNYTTGDGPESVCAADFDNDGVMDMATADLGADEISILTGNGLGGFVRTANYTAGDNPIFITCGDLDNDGWVDLVTANLLSDDVTVFKNQGTGLFDAGFDLYSGDGPNAVHAADLDADGDLDLVVSAGTDNLLMVHFNDGQAGYDPPVGYGTGTSPFVGPPTDVDGDGDLDVVHGNANSHNIWVRLNGGNGALGTVTAYATSNFPNALAAADFDGDGAMDLVSANRYGDDVTVLLNHLSLSGTDDGDVPAATALLGNVPNPFNPTTRVAYTLRRAGHVRLTVHDARGTRMATLVDTRQEAGRRFATWDGRGADGRRAASGVYFARLVTEAGRETRKMVMIK